jgi:hypothetical protein
VKGLVLVVSCLVLAGCGSGAGQGVTLPPGTSTTATTAGVADAGGAKFSYRGSTSQRQRLTIAVDKTALAKFRLQLRCKDGGSTVAAIATLPHRPNLQPDGSFYYSETGTTEFSGFGSGRYRVAMAGQLQGANGAGHASFRISFKSTTCRTAVSWQVKKV